MQGSSRFRTRFSADGALAACLAADRAEVWDFTGPPRPQLLSTAHGATQLLPLARRAALLARPTDDGHDLVRLAAGTDPQRLRTIGAAGFRLVASPGRGALALSWTPPTAPPSGASSTTSRGWNGSVSTPVGRAAGPRSTPGPWRSPATTAPCAST